MAAPADLGLKGDPPEALDAYTDPSSLDAPQSLSVVDFSQTKGLADMIAEGKLSTTFKFAYNQVLLAQREPLLYSDPNTLVVGSHDIDLPTVVASKLLLGWLTVPITQLRPRVQLSGLLVQLLMHMSRPPGCCNLARSQFRCLEH